MKMEDAAGRVATVIGLFAAVNSAHVVCIKGGYRNNVLLISF